MVAKLIAEEGNLKGLTLTLQGGNEWIIGRDPDACQLLVEDPATSRKHSICRKTAQGFVIENLSESRPTKVNNINLQTPHTLVHGDVVTIGNEIFRFVMDNETNEQSHFDESIPVTDIEKEENPFAEEDSEHEAEEEEQKQVENVMNPEQKETSGKKTGQTGNENTPPSEHKNNPVESSPNDEESAENTIFDEFDEGDEPEIAEIDFGLMETGRWLLKVISGPNNGAEFNMQTGHSYTIGTDPSNCDIVFHDTSVSRQHAKITIDDNDIISFQDLQSRNGSIIEGEKVQGVKNLDTNVVVTMGTTSFIIYDREGEMQTIISPLLPDIVKKLTQENEVEKKIDTSSEEEHIASQGEVPVSSKPIEVLPPPKKEHHLSTIIMGAIVFGIFSVVGFGIYQLFKEEPVVKEQQINAEDEIRNVMKNFASVSFFYSPKTGSVQLIGHVLDSSDKSRMVYDLKNLNLLKSPPDDTGVIVDQIEVKEFNQILEKTKWKTVNIFSPSPGKFILTGSLKTRAEADQLNDYINSNFTYVDLLEKKLFVDEDVVNSVQIALQKQGINDVSVKLDNRYIILAGGVPPTKMKNYLELVKEFKKIPEIRDVKDLVSQYKAEESLVNISDRYKVTGISKAGDKLNVVVNGRILFIGDNLDGMTVKEIRKNSVLLEKDHILYRIDF